MLEIQIDRQAQPRLCTLQGRLDSNTAPDFEQGVLNTDVFDGADAVALDCSGLEYVSSAGLRVILLLVRKAQALGRPLVFAGLRANVRSVLEISGMLGLLRTCESIEAAQAALKA